jgi:hypothetical protein
VQGKKGSAASVFSFLTSLVKVIVNNLFVWQKEVVRWLFYCGIKMRDMCFIVGVAL